MQIGRGQTIGWQCAADVIMCRGTRLRCPECAAICTKVALEAARKGEHVYSSVTIHKATLCDQRIPNKIRFHGGVWRRAT